MGKRKPTPRSFAGRQAEDLEGPCAAAGGDGQRREVLERRKAERERKRRSSATADPFRRAA